ncbi:MAG: S-ribosylhomocysteine lyase, partial [bacterium]|nr:S-ribosylhomocysteine lyase [bacterium]
MKKIESFQVDHLKLNRGIFVSRKDVVGTHTITTFDIRLKRPNREPVMNTGEIHAIEHLAATFLRNHSEYKDKTVYFGPMGCRTGFYVIFKGDLTSDDVIEILREMFCFIARFEGEVPGADPKSCGNYLDMDLSTAKIEADRFLKEVL